MDSVKLVPLLVGLLIAVVMVGAVFVPVVQSSTTRTVTTEIENEGAEWLKLGYNQGTDYSFTVGFDGEDNFTVGTQTGEYKNLICYADNERTLFVSGDYWYMLTTGESSSVYKFTDNASVTNASGTLTIMDGSDTIFTGASPTWAYVPDANGVYGFFTEGGLNLKEGKPTVAVGSYAGAFAYNNTVLGPGGVVLNLVMSGNYADGEVTWVIPSEISPLTLEPISFEPSVIQPIDLDSGSVGLMSVPTPTYTDGVWGYELSNDIAKIVSYSGTPAPNENIIIPSTVGGYPAETVGKGGSFENVIPSGLGGNDLVISEGIKTINQFALNGLGTMKGAVYLPSTLTNVNGSAFANDLGYYGLVNLSSAAFNNSSFQNCTGIKEILNLGGTNLTTTSYGLNADSVQDYVSPLGYIAPTSIHESEVVPIDSPVAGLMQMLPLIAGIGALFLAVGTMIYTRF